MNIVALYPTAPAVEPVPQEVLAVTIILTVIELGILAGPVAAAGNLRIRTCISALPAVVDVVH
jgi:hypothetical protein